MIQQPVFTTGADDGPNGSLRSSGVSQNEYGLRLDPTATIQHGVL